MATKKTVGVRTPGSKYHQELSAKSVMVYNLEHPMQEAQLAFSLIERWGAVAAAPDGIDPAGRQKMRLQDPPELVGRAFAVARLAFEMARTLGLMVDLPDLNEINAAADAVDEQERAQSIAKRALKLEKAACEKD